VNPTWPVLRAVDAWCTFAGLVDWRKLGGQVVDWGTDGRNLVELWTGGVRLAHGLCTFSARLVYRCLELGVGVVDFCWMTGRRVIYWWTFGGDLEDG
jgi:hypothetical protein